MDDGDALTPGELREIALHCEGTLRSLHKELRRQGLPQASFAALEAADAALSTARSLAAEMLPPARPRIQPAAPPLAFPGR